MAGMIRIGAVNTWPYCSRQINNPLVVDGGLSMPARHRLATEGLDIKRPDDGITPSP